MKVGWKFSAVVILAVIALGAQNAFGRTIDWSFVWKEFRLLKLSMLLLAVAVFALLVVRGRKKRRAELPVKRQSLDELVPLRDDVAENVSKARLKWLEFYDRHFSELCKSVKRQVAARPNTWGAGLWSDEETEKIARKCAEIFKGWSDGAALNLIPADPMPMIDVLFGGDLDDVGALQEVEDAFRCKLPTDGYETMTFAQFVEHVKATTGTQPPRDRRAGCLLAIAKFVGMIAAFLALGVATNVIGKFIGLGFVMLAACWLATLVANLFVTNGRTRVLLSQLRWAIAFAAVLYAMLLWN